MGSVTYMSDYDQLDLAILQTIDALREEHDACTARAVANELKYSADVVRYRLQKMMNDDIVKWTEMPGSLVRLTLPALEVVGEDQDESIPEEVVAPLPETKGAKPQGSARRSTSSAKKRPSPKK